MTKSITTLEFNKIIDMLCENAISDHTKNKLKELKPYLDERKVLASLKDTTEARKILDHIGSPPLASMKDIPMLLELSEKGAMLIPEQLSQIGLFINSCKRMKAFLQRAESLNVDIASYGYSFYAFTDLCDQIDQCIRNNMVDDNASKDLKDIRRKISQIGAQVKAKLETQLRSKKEWFSEGFVSMRNGRYVLPVKKEYKNMVNGSVLDISSSGSTYFIEPTAASKLRDELSILEIEESNEERRILYILSDLVSEKAPEIRMNIEGMETLDFIFAKAKLSIDMKAVPPIINTDRRIHIKNGRHPLIDPSSCVPLNFTIGEGIRGVVITGPNTGGKTVTLKTVGLFEMMAASGLHVPCESADLCLNNSILCDIGDGQSITENLSTFSSHIMNIIHILSASDRDSLILLDELGSGTDPAEGMGIAIAVLEELRKKECLFVVTTHYPEIKEYANQTDGFLNARMAFDRESLKPLYQLELGEAGESCALYIAKRLGLPTHMLKRAYEEAYIKHVGTHRTTPEDAFLYQESSATMPTKATLGNVVPQVIKAPPVKIINTRSQRFQVGDSVMVYPQKKIGIVYRTANEKGEIGVQIQKNKELVNHKRLQLKVSADQMYPEDYDFSIIFDTVANRKARHKMNKGYQADLEIKRNPDELI